MINNLGSEDIHENNLPLVSMIIISYNNGEFLPESVQSVLEQNYPNIELIISDDGSYDFTLEEMKKVIVNSLCGKKRTNKTINVESHILEKYKNIKSLYFNKNEVNYGTVKHLKKMKSMASGKYIMFLAADDKLHDKNVIKDLISYFEELPSDAYVLTSQCGMYDYNLNTLYYFVLNDELKQILLSMDTNRVYEELTKWCFIPAAGTIYKAEVFEVFGDLDEKYHLIEDWTYFLKLSRTGAKIYFLDRLTYMHRDGGISHGNMKGGNEAWKHYLEDSLLLMENEMLPYLDVISSKQAQMVKKAYKDLERKLYITYSLGKETRERKIRYIINNSLYYIPRILGSFVEYLNVNSNIILKSSSILVVLGVILAGYQINEKVYVVGLICELVGILLILAAILFKATWLFFKIGETFRRIKS